MDERKGSSRPFLKFFVLSALGAIILFGGYGAFVFWKTQNIEDPKKCFITKMYQVNLCPSNPNYVRFKQVPKHFFQALILSEDASFYSHKGFDWFEIKESFRRNILEWKYARGGSTLTQQLAKNLYLTQSKSIDRKFREFFIARQIEKKLSKTQILEKYVNVVEFGKDIYGVKAAARHYFGKIPETLNVLESVYLVSLLPSPVRLGRSFEDRQLSKNNLWRMKVILQRMYRTGKINDEIFVYAKMLLEDSDWPFDQFSDGLFEPMSIEDQLFEEFNDLNEPEFEVTEEEANEFEAGEKEETDHLNSSTDSNQDQPLNDSESDSSTPPPGEDVADSKTEEEEEELPEQVVEDPESTAEEPEETLEREIQSFQETH